MPGLVQGKGGRVNEMMIISLAELSELWDWVNLFPETEPRCKHAEAVLILSHWVLIKKKTTNKTIKCWLNYTSEGLNLGFFLGLAVADELVGIWNEVKRLHSNPCGASSPDRWSAGLGVEEDEKALPLWIALTENL